MLMDVSSTPPPELPNPARAPLEQREHLGQLIQRVSHRSLLRCYCLRRHWREQACRVSRICSCLWRLWQHERRFVRVHAVAAAAPCLSPTLRQLGHYGCGTFNAQACHRLLLQMTGLQARSKIDTRVLSCMVITGGPAGHGRSIASVGTQRAW